MSDKQQFVLSEHTIRDLSANELAYLRKILFVQPETKEALHDWIHLFLDLDLPGTRVDAATNSSPLDMVWETYNAARLNNNPDFHRILFFASRDSFKCSAKGTRILTASGIQKIENIVPGTVVWTGRSWQPVIQWIDDGEKPGIELTTKRGYRTVHSPVHRLWCLRNGQEQWIAMQDLDPETDLVCINTDVALPPEPRNSEDYDVGYFLGLLMGDGTTTQINRNGQSGICTVDEKIVDFLYSFNDTYLHGSVRKADFCGRRAATYYFGAKTTRILKSWGVDASHSYDKKIPERAWRSRSSLMGFICGVFDTDGTFAAGGLLFSMTAETLLRELQIALASFGVFSTFRSNGKLYGQQRHMVHSVSVSMHEYQKLVHLGFAYRAHKAGLPKTPQIPDAHDVIPVSQLGFLYEFLKANPFHRLRTRVHRDNGGVNPSKFYEYGSISRSNLQKYCIWAKESIERHQFPDNVWASKVVDRLSCVLKNKWCSFTIRPIDKVHFFDFTVQDDHSYWSNGFISHNTLCAAVLEVVMIVLLRRDVAHIAAILDQSRKAKQYSKIFFGQPVIRDFVTGMSERHMEFTHPDGRKVTQELMVMTLQGTNSPHPSLLVLDELDVIRNPEAYTELAFVASPRDGVLPITLLTSSRKWRFGPVQQEIDNAPDTGLLVRHWNILDVTEKCPASRCLSDLPRIPIYRSDLTLKSLSEPDFSTLDPDDAKSYVRDSGYVGCLKNCTLFAACRGRLHTHQTCTSNLLKPIVHVQNLFKSASLDKVKAQMLCWKPSTEGLVYTTLEQTIHRKTAGQIAEMIDGVPRPASFRKADLVAWVAQLVADQALTLKAGIDWGFTHNYVFTLWVLDGQKRSHVLECLMAPGLELDQVVDMTMRLLEPYGGHKQVLCYPDNAYPAYIKTFRRRGFRCQDFKKDVQGGIEAARYAMMDAVGDVRMFFLADDPGVDLLWKHLSQYHWKLDAAGRPTDEPDEENDDGPDTVRYFAQNVYTQSRGVMMSTHQTPQQRFQSSLPAVYPSSYETYLSQIVRDTVAQKGGTPTSSKGRRGSLVFSFGNDDSEVADTISVLKSLGKKPPSQS